jgi:hypothetical protein
MGSPLPVWAKIALRGLCLPLVSLGSGIRHMIGHSSNDLEAFKLALSESRRLEEVDKYYLKKLYETGMLLSQYHRFLLLNEFPHQSQSSAGYKEFYENNTAYDMERKNVRMVEVIRHHGKSQEVLTLFSNTISLMQELRVAYASQFFIGVCGPQNSGKSTFINTFGFQAKVGMVEHTTEARVYQLPRSKNVILIDFPGSTSISNHTDIFLTSGHIPNIYVFVSSYNGTPDTTLIHNILYACTMKILAGKYCEVVFCLNKAYAAVKERFDEDKSPLNFENQKRKDTAAIQRYIMDNLDEVRTEQTDENTTNLNSVQINKKIFTPDYDEILQCLNELKIFYTDWKDFGQENAIKAGIVGPDFIKAQLKSFAKTQNLLF